MKRLIGWAYFIPVEAKEVENGFLDISVRWLGWRWPVVSIYYLHRALCFVHGIDKGINFYWKEKP